MTSRRSFSTSCAVAAGILLAAAPLHAEEADAPAADVAPPAAGEADPLIEAPAVEALRRMVETLTKAERMSFETDEEYDAIQDDGEALEFGRSTKTTIRRPDRVSGETWDRGGRHMRFVYDGHAAVVYDEQRNAYATTPRTGDIDGLLDFLRDDVGFKIPLADLVATDLRQLLVDTIVAARLVDQQRIGRFDCDHVGVRLDMGVDVQFWIRKGDLAVPDRIVISYVESRGRPEFRATFRNWDLSPRTPDSLFAFRAPKGATQIPFAVSKRRPQPDAEETGR